MFVPRARDGFAAAGAAGIGEWLEAIVLAAVSLSDEPGSKPWKEITDPGLKDLRPADRYGEAWTESVADTDARMRTDFLFSSGSLAERTSPKHCRIIRHPLVTEASSHRPLCATFVSPRDHTARDSAESSP